MRSWSTERKTLTAFMGTAAVLALVLIAAYVTTLQFVDSSARLLYTVLVAVSVVFIVSLGWLLWRILADLDERHEVESRLQRANQFLESLLENIPTMIFAKGAKDLRFVRLNRAGEQLLGLGRDELLGKSDFDLFPREQAEFFTGKDRQVLAQGDIIDIPMEEIDTRTHGRRILHTRKVPVRDESGKPALLLGISMDITEQKATELRIVRLNAELKRHASLLESSNQELESFCYSVSHDLRAPLRAINGYARLLEQEHSGRLSSDGLRYVQTICAASERMAQLIDDLLEFARLGRQTLERSEVDMTAVARSATQEVFESRPAPQPEVLIEELPPALGDRRMLYLAWLNLLDNAVKYSSGVAVPRIRVWAENKDGEIVYAVRDNGIGFDMRYYDKLFGVFQRLHANPEYPGTGVGLAITQRIVARHGGRIWAQSEPGGGATFCFAMPVSVQATGEEPTQSPSHA